MPRMAAADAGGGLLRREGVTHAFGLTGAAINPFYAAMRRDGGISHTLARHVEGASHMAEGYTRTRAGNIGVCIGTPRPARPGNVTRPDPPRARPEPVPRRPRPAPGSRPRNR